MRVWRLGRTTFIEDLTGTGARLAGGRWSSKGVPVLYCSGTRSLCALELFVHLDPDDAPEALAAMSLHIPDAIFAARTLWTRTTLPPVWRDSPAPVPLQALGDAWVKRADSLVLELPSAVVPGEPNYLLNPSHPDMQQVVASPPEPFQFDPRMWRSRGG